MRFHASSARLAQVQLLQIMALRHAVDGLSGLKSSSKQQKATGLVSRRQSLLQTLSVRDMHGKPAVASGRCSQTNGFYEFGTSHSQSTLASKGLRSSLEALHLVKIHSNRRCLTRHGRRSLCGSVYFLSGGLIKPASGAYACTRNTTVDALGMAL